MVRIVKTGLRDQEETIKKYGIRRENIIATHISGDNDGPGALRVIIIYDDGVEENA